MSCAGNCYRANVKLLSAACGVRRAGREERGGLAVLVRGVRKREALLLSPLRMLRSSDHSLSKHTPGSQSHLSFSCFYALACKSCSVLP